MTKIANGRSDRAPDAATARMPDLERFVPGSDLWPFDPRDDLHLKRALQLAVRRDFAPNSLIESIRQGIRA